MTQICILWQLLINGFLPFQIVFPAGVLQSPFFSIDYPRSLNFGAMGVVMGHELSHAFDDQGREYDANGVMLNWWQNVTLNEFKKR